MKSSVYESTVAITSPLKTITGPLKKTKISKIDLKRDKIKKFTQTRGGGSYTLHNL